MMKHVSSLNQLKLLTHAILDRLTIFFLVRGVSGSVGSVSLTRLGSDYGGWIIPSHIKENNEKYSIALISGGLGTDVSFDLEMLELGAKVIGIDPTPKSVEFVTSEFKYERNFELIEACISHSSKPLILYPPMNADYASWSSISDSVNSGVAFPCVTLEELMEKSEIRNSDFLILKLDIEGAEIPILLQAAEIPRIDICLVEMDFVARKSYKNFKSKIQSALATRVAIRKMFESGFTLVAVEGYNFSWVRSFRLQNFEGRVV